MEVDFGIRTYVQVLAEQRAAKISYAEYQKEQKRQQLARELNHNSVHFNHEGRTESNLIKIDRSVFKKSKEERLLSNAMRSQYKEDQRNLNTQI